MGLIKQTAKHFRDVHFGGNWVCVNMKDTLDGITWEQATSKIDSFNTIAALVFHINYYVSAVLKVLQGEPLNASDKYSFDVPDIKNDDDWEKLVRKILVDAETFAIQIENLPEEKMFEIFIEEKYGNYFRNIYGIIEHTHYHLGQIVIIKKLLLAN